MTDREKLMKLLYKAQSTSTEAACFDDITYAQQIEMEADILIANGVTFQKWIPVTERLPDEDQKAICIMDDGSFRVFRWSYIDWMWDDGNEWYKEKDITHWMPLPEPPQEE